MTQRTPPPGSKAGFADLRQQIAALVCATPTPPEQIGQLPEQQTRPAWRGTLDFNTRLEMGESPTKSEPTN